MYIVLWVQGGVEYWLSKLPQRGTLSPSAVDECQATRRKFVRRNATAKASVNISRTKATR